MRIAVVGGGITGLTAAYRLSQKGHQVTLLEKENYLGGLAAGFKKKNWHWSLENFFHHLFVSDQAAKNLITELGLSSKLFYRRPKTSIFLQNKISQFDSPFSLLRFHHLSFLERTKVGIIMTYLKGSHRWQQLEKMTAQVWLTQTMGEKPYRLLWQPLLRGKFGRLADQISMAWFWARIKKRSSKLGYFEGGFQILIEKLAQEIKANNGQIKLNQEISLEEIKDNKFDKTIVTVSTQKFFKTNLPPMLGAINLVLVLQEKFLTDGTYWLNINENGFPFIAVVEHTNFIDPQNYAGDHLLYVGGYYPQDHRYFKMTKKGVLKEFLPYLKKINPQIKIKDSFLLINQFAQPVVPPNYRKIIPQMKTSIPNVYLANMQMVYPWDRGINYAIELGEKIVEEI